MQHNTSHIINRLKRQPRHGTSLPSMDDLEKTAKAALDSLQVLPDIMAKMADAFFAVSDKMTAVRKASAQLARGLDKVSQINEYLAGTFNAINKSMSILEIRNAAINKSFGISSIATAKLADTYMAISKNLKITNDQTNQYAGSIHKLLPTFNQLGKENDETYLGLVATQHVLQTQLGLSEELANSYSLYAAQTGKNAVAQLQITDEIAKSLDPEGTIGDYHSIISDIAGLTEDIQLQFGRGNGKLEVAVLRSKQLGVSFAQVSKAGDNLLNIESSIGQELDYQMLTGRRLVDDSGRSLTEKMRTAKFMGDSVGLQAAMQEILEKEKGTLETNLFARKEMSELLGMDEATMAKTLQKMTLLKSVAAKGIDLSLSSDAEGKIKTLADANYTSDEIATMLDDNTRDTRTTNDILSQQLTVAQDMAMMMMIQGSDEKSNFKLVEAVQKAMLDQSEGITDPAKNPFLKLNSKELQESGNFMFIKQLQAQYALAPSKAISAEASSKMQTSPDVITKDGIIPPGLGGVISMPAGTVGFQENDGIAIGTNIASNTAASSTGNTDSAKLASSIEQQTVLLVKALEQLGRQQSAFGPGLNSSYFS